MKDEPIKLLSDSVYVGLLISIATFFIVIIAFILPDGTSSSKTSMSISSEGKVECINCTTETMLNFSDYIIRESKNKDDKLVISTLKEGVCK